jgi:hypothetical protein
VTWLPLLFVEDAGAGTLWLTGLVFVVQWFYTASLTVNNVWQVESASAAPPLLRV